MRKIYLFLSIIIFCISYLKSQSITPEESYQYNTAISKSSYYISLKKYKCALKVLNNLDDKIISKIYQSAPNTLHYHYAVLYLLNGDSNQSAGHFLKFISNNGTQIIPELVQENNQFHFVYLRNKKYLDSLYLSYSYNLKTKGQEKFYKESLNTMLAEDQFARNNFSNSNKLTIHEDDGFSIRATDSIHLVKLIKLLDTDSNCIIMNNEFMASYILFLHLTRYDTLSFNKIISYNNRCAGEPNGINPTLIDNRISDLYKQQSIHEYLFESNFSDSLDFKTIDIERKKIGLQSLYFTILKTKKKIPDYYKNYEQELTCNE